MFEEQLQKWFLDEQAPVIVVVAVVTSCDFYKNVSTAKEILV